MIFDNSITGMGYTPDDEGQCECYKCGSRMYDNSEYEWHNDELYCPSCYEIITEQLNEFEED